MSRHKDQSGERIIVFRVENEEYGTEVNQVKSIEDIHEVIEIPGTIEFVKGIISVNGVLIPIIDLADRFGLGDTKFTYQSKIIVVDIRDLQVGFLVDSIDEVRNIPPHLIGPAPKTMSEDMSRFVMGMAILEDHLIILINLKKVLEEDELKQLEKI